MPRRNAEDASVRSLAALLLPAVAISASLEERRGSALLTRYSRYATPANAFRRCYSTHQPAGEGEGGGRQLERGGDGAARARRIRRAGDGASAGDLRRPDRRVLCAAGSEAGAGDLSQVRAAGPVAAQPPRGGEGQAPRLEGALSGERGAADPRHQGADGRGHDAGGHPALLRLLPGPARWSGAVAGRALRGAGEGDCGEAGAEALAPQGAGAAPRREPAARRSIRQGHGENPLRNHRTGRAREGVTLL